MKFNVEFTDHEDSSIYVMLRDWANLINGVNEEVYEDVDIKQFVESGEPSIIGKNEAGDEIYLYSSGIKKNGKIDICVENRTTGEKNFHYDCIAEMPYEQKVDESIDKTNMVFQV